MDVGVVPHHRIADLLPDCPPKGEVGTEDWRVADQESEKRKVAYQEHMPAPTQRTKGFPP